MSAVQFALGIGEDDRVGNVSDLILTTSQLVAFRQVLAAKVTELADPAINDPLDLQYRRGEIAALSLIINSSISAADAAKDN